MDFVHQGKTGTTEKKNKEIKHHTETIKVRDLTKNKKIDNQTINSKEDKVYKPGTPRDKY